MGPQGQKHGIKALGQQAVHGDIPSQALIAMDLNPQVGDHLDVLVQHGRGQAVVGNPHPQHAAGFGQGLENLRVHPFFRQVEPGGQPGRAGPDDGHFFSDFRIAEDLNFPGIELVCGQALEVPDGHRCIHLASSAGVFTLVRADPAQDPGQRQLFHDDLQGLFELALLDHLHISLDIESGRTGQPAGGVVCFFNGPGRRHGLGIELEGGLAVPQVLVEPVGQLHRAHLAALAAGGAFFQIDVPGMLRQGHRKIAGLPFHGFDRALSQKLHVQVPPGLHQLGGDYAHGAVIGGKGLVQLGHGAADGRVAVHQVHQVPGIGQIQGGLDSGNAGTDHHYRSFFHFGHVVSPCI